MRWLLISLTLACAVAQAQLQSTQAQIPSTQAQLPSAQAQPPSRQAQPATAQPATASSSAKTVKPAPPVVTRPQWAELTVAQQQALAPLSSTWNAINEAQKRKWLALSKNYPNLLPAEQATLHSRMSEWAALSPQQRADARLNFAESKNLPVDDKKAKWEAYKALPAEEKQKLAADAQAGTKKSTPAAAIKPVSPQKLVTLPPAGADGKSPRIASGPQSEGSTLLAPPASAPAKPQPN